MYEKIGRLLSDIRFENNKNKIVNMKMLFRVLYTFYY